MALGSLALAAAALFPPAAAAADPTADAIIERFVRNSAGAGQRIEVEVGQLDPRVQLAPCERIEPYVTPGARLWGRTIINVRCVAGASWSVSLPLTVRVYGQALVANGTLLANAPAGPQDFHLAEIDLTRESGQLLTDASLLAGKTLARPMAAGQTLRADYLRVQQTVAPGDPVRVRLLGNGFEIAAEGTALSGAGDGQTVRIRMESGRVVAGTVRDRAVEIRM